jgi:hypothetical protein
MAAIERDYQFYQRLRNLLRRPTVKSRIPAERPSNRMETRIFGAFAKVASNQYMHSLAGSTERLARSRDYEMMDINSSILSTALNIFADDSTTHNEDGKILHIASTSIKIKEILEDLFFDRLAIEDNLWHWIRNMCKYGDFFLLLDVIENEGITSFMALPTVEIEREEAFDGDINSVRYKWNTASAVVFDSWQIAHFRIVSDDTFLPYGKSLIEPARRIWKQLNLIEDAMLVYRIQRAPERRIFYIDVGNISANDVPAFMQKAKDILKRSPLVDQQGNVDLRYNVHPIHKDTMIPLLDGRTITIENLAKEYDSGKENWVYSLKNDVGPVVPGKVKWCGKNYTATKLVQVTLDDGGIFKAAPEHPFILRDGSNLRADQLKEGMSLMPFYRNMKNISWQKNSSLYETVYNPLSDKYEFTHKLINLYSTNGIKEFGDETIIHHKDFNRFNNCPENLIQMKKLEHWKYHQDNAFKLTEAQEKLRLENIIKWNKSDRHRAITVATNKKYDLGRKMGLKYNRTELHKQHNAIRSKAMYAMWNNNDKKIKAQSNMKNVWTDEMIKIIEETREKISKDFNKSRTIKLNKIAKEIKNNKKFIELWNKNNTRKCSINRHNISQFIPINHSISKIEIINENVDVYCMEVVGESGQHDRHNVAIVDSTNKSGVFIKQSQEEDYFLPIRGKDGGTKIDTLKGAENLGDIDDVRYVQCLRGNTKIKLLNGTSKSIKNIVDDNDFSNLWTMSINPKTLALEPSRIISGKKTRLNAELIRIHLDNNEIIDCTPDHLFLMRNGEYVQAQNLKENDSLMPLYTKISNAKENYLDGYEMIYNPSKQCYDYTHQIVGKSKYSNLNSKKNIIHHVNFNKLDNTPKNLLYFENGKLHSNFHAQLNKIHHKFNNEKNPKFRQDIRIEGIIEKAHSCKTLCELYNKFDCCSSVINKRLKLAGYKSKSDFIKREMPLFEGRKLRKSGFENYNISLEDIKKVILKNNYWSINQIANHFNVTRKFINIVICQTYDDLRKMRYDVLQINIESIIDLMKNKFNSREVCQLINLTPDEFRCFLKINGYKNSNDLRKKNNISLKNCWNKGKKGLQVTWSKGQHKYKQVYLNHKVIKVEKLSEKEDTYDIQVSLNSNFALDSGIFVHNSNLIASLGIPRAYLTFEEMLAGKTTLSQEDIRFAKTINRIQKFAVSELNKIAMIHLYSLGFTDVDDLTDFKLLLTNPSTVNEQMKLELLKTRFDTYQTAVQSVGYDRDIAQKKILRLTQTEIEKINKGIFKDTKFNAELQQIAQDVANANMPQGGDGGEGGPKKPFGTGNVGTGGKQPNALPVGQPPVDIIPGGNAKPSDSSASNKTNSIFKNNPKRPMSMTNPTKKDVKEEEEIEEVEPSISGLFDPTKKEDKEILNIAKKYDFLSNSLQERSKISKELGNIFISLDKKLGKN